MLIVWEHRKPFQLLRINYSLIVNVNVYFSHVPEGSEISPGYQRTGPTSPLHSVPSEMLYGAKHFYVIFNDTRHAGNSVAYS